jgi:hypothetical protein
MFPERNERSRNEERGQVPRSRLLRLIILVQNDLRILEHSINSMPHRVTALLYALHG